MTDDRGVFTISLDTELAWGTFDVDRVARYADAYRRTPAVVDGLCDLFETYSIPATWAVVAHLLVDCDGAETHADRTRPAFDWIEDWFEAMPCSSGLDADLWYAPWLLERLQECGADQEIGLHAATHMPLGASGCSRPCAQEELEDGIATLENHGVTPSSFVFPRNEVGHVDVLKAHGIGAYREVDARWYERQRVDRLKPPFRYGEELSRRTPPVVEPSVRDGVVAIPGSQIFRPRRGPWRYTMPGSSVARAKKGLRRAASTGGVFHLWFHPFNLAHAPRRELGRFERVLAAASDLVDAGELTCRPMADVATLAHEGRWD